jgi:XRE family transcriptional regulator, regulator of sulfur utilization
MDNINIIVSNNLKKIRKQKQLSLQEVSAITDVSKSMLGEIERGVSNPTISILWKISNGLKIPFTSLIKQGNSEISIVHYKNKKAIIEAENLKVIPIFDFDQDKKFEIFYKEILPGGRLESEGHSSGMEEYIIVYEGELGIEIDNETYTLLEGDAIKFCAECCHLYFNKANSSTKFYMIMYYS